MRQLNITRIPSYPTVIGKTHESLYRSYQVLNVIQHLLEEDTPPQVVLAILLELRGLEGLKEEWSNE